jgi:nucleotide-binding universal stress UspA family protein
MNNSLFCEGVMEIKKVLVPTDFSLPSRMAVNYGVAVARKFRAKLTLVHVLEAKPARTRGSEASKAATGVKRREDAIRELWALLAPEDQDDLDLQVVLKDGNVQKEIAAAIEEQRPDIVVLGTHGHGRLGRLVIGSTTESLLRKLSIPMLTVSNVVRPMAFKRILFATDLSEAAHRGFTFALDMARTLHSDILAIHTLTTTEKTRLAAQTRDLAIEEARRNLTRLVAEGKFHNIKVETVLTEGSPAEQILKAAEESAADLILLMIAVKGAVERALIGTTAEHVVREARVPVLAIPVHMATYPETVGETR